MGAREFCGYAISDDFADRALYLSHSTQGDFVLFLKFPGGHHTMNRTDGYVQALPALEGPVTDDPWLPDTLRQPARR